MGIVELIIVILILLWLFGYFGRSRLGTGSLASGNLIHTLLVIVVILVILRLLNLI
jgi:uncharacterized protein DUF5670